MNAYELATRYIGVSEIPGIASNKEILKMLLLDNDWPDGDHVPWCSAFINYIAWHLRLPRSKSLRARSWLSVGIVIDIDDAEPGYDVVIIKRGEEPQPGPDKLNAIGHVGFFAGLQQDDIYLLGGNQSNSVNITPYPVDSILGVRRLV